MIQVHHLTERSIEPYRQAIEDAVRCGDAERVQAHSDELCEFALETIRDGKATDPQQFADYALRSYRGN
jgi:hypothetical protein